MAATDLAFVVQNAAVQVSRTRHLRKFYVSADSDWNLRTQLIALHTCQGLIKGLAAPHDRPSSSSSPFLGACSNEGRQKTARDPRAGRGGWLLANPRKLEKCAHSTLALLFPFPASPQPSYKTNLSPNQRHDEVSREAKQRERERLTEIVSIVVSTTNNNVTNTTSN